MNSSTTNMSKLARRRARAARQAELASQDVKVLGHTFKPMDRNDWDCFAGADEDSLICYCSDERTVLIYSPSKGTVSEISGDPDHGADREVMWTSEAING
jgi:hypothetical protein